MSDKDKRFEHDDNDFSESALTGSFIELEDDIIEDAVIHEEEAQEIPEDNFEAVSNEEPTKQKTEKAPKEKKAPKAEGGNKNLPLIIGVVFVVALIGFVAWLVLSTYSEMKQEAQTQPVQYAETPAVETQSQLSTNNVNDASSFAEPTKSQNELAKEYVAPQVEKVDAGENGYGVPPEPSSDSSSDGSWGNESSQPEEAPESDKPTKDFYEESVPTTAPISAVESEMMGISPQNGSFDSNSGGVCDLSVKFKPDQYIYYVLEGETYVPVFQKKDWDGKGIIIDNRVVTLSYDNINKFTEIEKGKFIPSEMFSKCSAFERR